MEVEGNESKGKSTSGSLSSNSVNGDKGISKGPSACSVKSETGKKDPTRSSSEWPEEAVCNKTSFQATGSLSLVNALLAEISNLAPPRDYRPTCR